MAFVVECWCILAGDDSHVWTILVDVGGEMQNNCVRVIYIYISM